MLIQFESSSVKISRIVVKECLCLGNDEIAIVGEGWKMIRCDEIEVKECVVNHLTNIYHIEEG